MADIIRVGDKTVQRFIAYEDIMAAIGELAARINEDYADRPEPPVLLGILNGSFMFVSELAQRLNFPCKISFVKVASYSGTQSTGNVKELIGVDAELKGRDVIIVEDIVETGDTLDHILGLLSHFSPSGIEIATLLVKPNKYQKEAVVKYSAFSIPDNFVVGFGLDYDGLGRNLKDIYTIVDEK